MTTLNSSQLSTVNVLGGTSNGFQASHLSAIVVASAPVAVSMNASQLFAIVVMANGSRVQSLDRPIKLGCWTPCGTLIWNPNGGIN